MRQLRAIAGSGMLLLLLLALSLMLGAKSIPFHVLLFEAAFCLCCNE